MKLRHTIKAIVIGASKGGIDAITTILPRFSSVTPPIFITLHRHADSGDFLPQLFSHSTRLSIIEPEDKTIIQPSTIYIAPPNYHMLIESTHSIALSIDPLVCYSRPSVDVLFESAADVYKHHLLGILLTGANNDGSQGLKKIKMKKGLTMIEDPSTADAPEMPTSAMQATQVDYILSINEIGAFIRQYF